jgi:hypothetical protein
MICIGGSTEKGHKAEAADANAPLAFVQVQVAIKLQLGAGPDPPGRRDPRGRSSQDRAPRTGPSAAEPGNRVPLGSLAAHPRGPMT